MPDDPRKVGLADRKRISLKQDYEVRYWCKRFSCTPARLRQVVKEVGHQVVNVEKALAPDPSLPLEDDSA